MIRAGQRPNTEEIVLLTSDTQSTQRGCQMTKRYFSHKKKPLIYGYNMYSPQQFLIPKLGRAAMLDKGLWTY